MTRHTKGRKSASNGTPRPSKTERTEIPAETPPTNFHLESKRTRFLENLLRSRGMPSSSSSTPTPIPPEEHDYKWVLGFQTELRCTEKFAAHIEREFRAFIKDKIDAIEAPTHPPNPCLWKTVLVTWKGDDETTKRSVHDKRGLWANEHE